MSSVRRIYVEKKPAYAVAAKDLFENIRDYLGIRTVTGVRVLIRYDIENISDKTYEEAKITIFSEPPVDVLYEEAFPMQDWDDVINVNLNSVFILCQEAAKVMLKKGYGKIINIASMISFFGGQTIPAYAAAKGGVAQVTKCMSNDLMARGINVNAIAPGYMATKMNEALLDPENPRYQEITNRIPAKRWGSGEDMKGTCIFLASHASDYLGGAVIPVDGGYLVK